MGSIPQASTAIELHTVVLHGLAMQSPSGFTPHWGRLLAIALHAMVVPFTRHWA